MSDVKTEDKTPEGTGQDETKQINTGTGEEMTPKDRGLMTQVGEWKSKAEQVQAENQEIAAKLAKYEADVAAAAEKKALEEGKHLELIEQLKSEKAALELKTRQSTIDEMLRNAGVESQWSRKGFVAAAPAEADTEALTKWIAELKTANPAEFQAPAKPVPQGAVGAPATNGGGSLEERLKSSDPKIKEAAIIERLNNTLVG